MTLTTTVISKNNFEICNIYNLIKYLQSLYNIEDVDTADETAAVEENVLRKKRQTELDEDYFED